MPAPSFDLIEASARTLHLHVGTPPGSVSRSITDAGVPFEEGASRGIQIELELLVVFEINSGCPYPAKLSIATSAFWAESKLCIRGCGRESLYLKGVRGSIFRSQRSWRSVNQGKGLSTEGVP